MRNEVEISLNEKTEVKINGVKIPNLFKLDIKRDAESMGTYLKLEFYVSDTEIAFY